MNINEFYAIRLSGGWDNEMLMDNDCKLVLFHDSAPLESLFAKLQTLVFEHMGKVIAISTHDTILRIQVKFLDNEDYFYDFTKIRISTVL